MTSTWSQVHVGDTVRGSDQRAWKVIARDTEREWLHEGHEARFELELGDRTVTAWQMLDKPAPLVERADHRAMAQAVQALIDNDIRFTITEERRVTQAQPQAAPQPIKRDRWGRYMLPHPQTGAEQSWTRATTLARVLADEYNLGQWAERMVAKGMALRTDLVAGAAAADPDKDKQALQGIAQQAKDAAGSRSGANLGTALHSFTERIDSGESLKSLQAPPPLGDDLAAYQGKLKAANIEMLPDWIERIVVCAELGAAGTLDRMGSCANGTRVVDLKTAKSVEYSWMEIAIQLAIYVNSSHAWNPSTQSYEAMPDDLDKRIGLVVHLPVGKATPEIWEVNLVEGWRLAQIALDVKNARSKAKKLARKLDVAEQQAADSELLSTWVQHADSRQALAQLWDTYYPQGLWTDEVQQAAQARLQQLQA